MKSNWTRQQKSAKWNLFIPKSSYTSCDSNKTRIILISSGYWNIKFFDDSDFDSSSFFFIYFLSQLFIGKYWLNLQKKKKNKQPKNQKWKFSSWVIGFVCLSCNFILYRTKKKVLKAFKLKFKIKSLNDCILFFFKLGQ